MTAKVLLADDSKEDRFLIRQALIDAGFDGEVEEASDGEQAELHLLRSMRNGDMPQFVILDLFLPKRSGVAIMETWFAGGLTKLTRIVVLSSVLPEAEIIKLRELGAWQVFEKPIDLDEFLALGKKVRDLRLAEEPD
jgi:DNA-binding response OmpR family regulator